MNRQTLWDMLAYVRFSTKITHTIFADIQLSKFGEVGNVGGDTYKVIFTKTQFSKIGQPEKFLQERITHIYSTNHITLLDLLIWTA